MDERADRIVPSPGVAPATRAAARVLAVLAAVDGLSGTVLAALASHLPDRAFIPGGRDMAWHAIQMQMWHAPVLLLLAFGMSLDRRRGRAALRIAAMGMALGLALFCGAVYAIAFAGRYSGPVAPTGGVLVMASWIVIGVSAWRALP